MLLSELLKLIGYERTFRFEDREVEGIGTDSTHAMQGDLFVCFAGRENDGHDFAAEAVASGAAALAVEHELDLPVPQIVVKDGRKAASEIASAFYGHPERKLKIIGITGTNGKTTTAHMLASILAADGRNCGNIGTLGIFYANRAVSPELTTPDPVHLYKVLADMAEAGMEYVAMEVSAHALYYGKVDGIPFEAGIYTNFTEDHLDFFDTMENYAAAKAKLFRKGRCRFALFNYDDEECRRIGARCENSYSYGLENPSDVFAVDVREDFDGCSYVINLFDEICPIRLQMPGLYNVYNSMAAAACAKLLGVSLPSIAAGLSGLRKVSGRLEHVARVKGADIFVDFAHTPDGLEKSLSALRRKDARFSAFALFSAFAARYAALSAIRPRPYYVPDYAGRVSAAARLSGVSAKRLFSFLRVPGSERSFAFSRTFCECRARLGRGGELLSAFAKKLSASYFAAGGGAHRAERARAEEAYAYAAELSPLLSPPVLERELGACTLPHMKNGAYVPEKTVRMRSETYEEQCR